MVDVWPSGKTLLARATGLECGTFLASFQLIAATNSCPCGYFSDPIKPCTCSTGAVTKYQKRISGPLLDRIDIHIEVPRVEYEKLSDGRLGESSETVRQRVEAAHERQHKRFDGVDGVTCNADMSPADVRKHCALDDASSSPMMPLGNRGRQ